MGNRTEELLDSMAEPECTDGYWAWNNAARPLAAAANREARNIAQSPMAYAVANILIHGYGKARERGVKKSRTGQIAWHGIPAGVHLPFRELVAGFDAIVADCKAPKPDYRVRTAGQALHDTDVLNALGDAAQNSGLSWLSMLMCTYQHFTLADFEPFLSERSPGIGYIEPRRVEISPANLQAFRGLSIWLKDAGKADAGPEELANLLIEHYRHTLTGFESRWISVVGWFCATSEAERRRWSEAACILGSVKDQRHWRVGKDRPGMFGAMVGQPEIVFELAIPMTEADLVETHG